jgi:hypothetical protein
VNVPDGGSATINYTITVTPKSTDTNFKVSGSIKVHNPAPMAATLIGVSDVISGPVIASVNCPALTVAAGGDLTCTYEATLPDGTSRTNTATATLQNTPSGTTDFSGQAAVTFGSSPSNETDECVQVTDPKTGVDTKICASDTVKTISTSTKVYQAQCGTFTNTASFLTNDNGETGSDSVDTTVVCLGKTMGFWGNPNGQNRIGDGSTVYPYTLGGANCYVVVNTTTDSNILPNQLNGYSKSVGCTLTAPKQNAFNTLLAQTLALYLNTKLVTGYSLNTVSSLQCTGYLTSALQAAPYSLSTGSSVNAVLTAANKAINLKGSTVTGDFNALLGCLNRES